MGGVVKKYCEMIVATCIFFNDALTYIYMRKFDTQNSTSANVNVYRVIMTLKPNPSVTLNIGFPNPYTLM